MKRSTIVSIIASAFLGTTAAQGQTATQTFCLDDVWFQRDGATQPTSQMTGTFEWTYEIGDFENGAGLFTELAIPGGLFALEELIVAIEPSTIEFSLDANLHDRGLDIIIKLLEPFSPNGPAAIDPVNSTYLIEFGTSTRGNIVLGSIAPCGNATCTADTNNDGTLTPADFTAWIDAFNTEAPECDQNFDGSCTPSDFTAWIANFNAGCP